MNKNEKLGLREVADGSQRISLILSFFNKFHSMDLDRLASFQFSALLI
jgi:hypothetical protein